MPTTMLQDDRRRMWPALARIAAATVSIWVLAAHVFVAFPRARVKLVTRPLAPAARVALPLGDEDRIPGERLVLVCRVRSAGADPVTITVRVGDRLLRATAVPGSRASRLDLSWPREWSKAPADVVTLAGSGGPWILEYAEIANLHGSSWGVFEFLVLPDGQPFDGPDTWWLLGVAACLAAAAGVRRPAIPRWARMLHGGVAIAAGALLTVIVLSPWLSAYRIVLAVHTFVLTMVLLWLPAEAAVVTAVVREMAALVVRSRLRTAKRVGLAAAGAAIVAYTVLLAHHVGAYAGGADSSGYANNARLLAVGRVSIPVRRVAGVSEGALPVAAYVPLGFRPHGGNEMAPTYPIGLPLALAASAPLVGWVRAPGIVMLLHAALGVLLVAVLARACGLSGGAAALAAVMLATSPLYLFMSLQLMSDTPALVWTTLAVVLGLRSMRARTAGWRELLAGAAVSMAILVRPTNVLVLLPIAVCLGPSWRRWAWLAAGGIPGAALLMAYNVAAYGHAITTGYGDASSAFTPANVLPSVRNYVTWLPVLLTPVGLLALGLPAIAGRGRRQAVALLAWAGSFLVFYAFYYHTHEWWWYLRFLLPAFPPLIVGALWVGSASWARWCTRPRCGRAAPWLLAGLMVAVLAHNAWWTRRLDALEIGRGERLYLDAARHLTATLPANAAVLTVQASGALLYYTGFPIVRWDRCDRASLVRFEAEAIDAGTPVYAVFFPFELEEQRAFAHIPGQWARAGRVRDLTVWRLVAP